MPASEYPFPVAGEASEYEHWNHRTKRRMPSAISEHISSPAFPTPVDAMSLAGVLPSVVSPAADSAEAGLTPGCSSFDTEGFQRGTTTIEQCLVGARPNSIDMPTPPQDRSLQLRLPCFDSLGIGNPHPDAISSTTARIVLEPVAGLPFLSPYREQAVDGEMFGACDDGKVGSSCIDSPIRRNPSLPLELSILTPPEEKKEIEWSIHNAEETEEVRRLSEGGHTDVPAFPMAQVGGGMPEGPLEKTASATPHTDSPESPTEVDELQTAIDNILSTLDSSAFDTMPLRVLSHALPSPSIPGHAFSRIINDMQRKLSARQLTWISLLHAVAGRFNLADLPVSPPSTPGIAFAGEEATEDYFTTTTLESAIHVDYSTADIARSTRHQPLAAPCTINVCIIERYIPPVSMNEFIDMFSITRHSLLVDRLVEVQPGNGCVMLLYPTRQGAQDFCESYLGPILDPLLRSMVVVNNFTADLSSAVGRMMAVPRMHDFETLKHKIETLCDLLNSKDNPHVRKRLHNFEGNFSVMYAERHHVSIERAIWTSWWTKQEKQRVREAVNLHFRLANRFLGDADLTPATIIQQILDGVESREYPEGQEPLKKIEMGCFILKRGRSSSSS